VLQADNVPADATDPNGPSMIFEGGSSIVADLRRRVVKYCIRKNLKSKNRLAQLQGFCMTQITNARSTSSTRIPTTRSASRSRCCTADCERGQPCQPFHAKLPRRRKQPSVAFVARGRLLVS
jgi:hypothetical protein